MFKFNEASLPEPLLKALLKMNFSEPTPIQAKAIPVALEGKDLIASAETGSGKTAAFGIPLMMKILTTENSQALILAPTRELSRQIADVLRELSSTAPQIKMAVLIGGADMHKQLRALKQNPRIIIATPGRLIDHLHNGALKLDHAQFLVLDEGDRMIDMGFAPQLDRILRFLPATRQTMMFSATVPPKVQLLAKKYLRSPVTITIGSDSRPPDAIKQTSMQTTHAKKNELLLDQLNLRKGSVIVFTRTKSRTDRVAKYLDEYGFEVTRLHGGRSQGQRNQALDGFRRGEFRILVATDIASRGIDVPLISHVINYDLPMMDEDYIHRIGRTARAGASGEALSLLTPEDKAQWMQLARKYKIPGVHVEPMSKDRSNGRSYASGNGKPNGDRKSYSGRKQQSYGKRSGQGQQQRSFSRKP